MISRWLTFLARVRLLDVLLAVALGSAAADLANRFATVAVGALAQHVAPDELGGLGSIYGGYDLRFTVANTTFVYGTVLPAALAVGLLSVAAWLISRREGRALRDCPFCAARVPRLATRCAICGSTLEPA